MDEIVTAIKSIEDLKQSDFSFLSFEDNFRLLKVSECPELQLFGVFEIYILTGQEEQKSKIEFLQ